MKVLIVKPHEHPFVGELADLEAMQECVGGYIEAIFPWPNTRAALVCDEDGLAHDSEWNRYICEGVAIKGTFFICGLGEDEFADLPDELMNRFQREFREPEMFIRMPGGVAVINRFGVRAVI